MSRRASDVICPSRLFYPRSVESKHLSEACKRMQVLLHRHAMNTSRAYRAEPPPRPRNARWLAMCPETRALHQLLSTPQPEGCLAIWDPVAISILDLLSTATRTVLCASPVFW